MQFIKLFGLQRSGTNYVTFLINENFPNARIMVNLQGWKHGYYIPTPPENEHDIIVVVKNPYAWLVSIYNYWGPQRSNNVGPDLRGVPFEDFVTNRIHFERQKDIPYLIRAANPVQHWNNMNFHWTSIRLTYKRMFVVRYESIIENPEPVLTKISESFGLGRKPQLVNCDKILEPSGETSKISEEKWMKKDYYLGSEYAKYYTPELIDFVNDQLDMEYMLGFGYQYLKGTE